MSTWQNNSKNGGIRNTTGTKQFIGSPKENTIGSNTRNQSKIQNNNWQKAIQPYELGKETKINPLQKPSNS